MTKISKNRQNLIVFIPSYGYVERIFRNKGEVYDFLYRNYGPDWQKQRVRIEATTNKRDFGDFWGENERY
jgi:hypothetical protein